MIFNNILNGIRKSADKFHSFNSNADEKYKKALFLSADPGMGKTYTALAYCDENKNSLYFSFEHIAAAFAPKAFSERYPDIFKGCSDWHTFFECLKIYGKEKRPTVFFDNAGERNDKDEFYFELNCLLDKNCSYDIFVVFMGRPWEKINAPCNIINIAPFSTQEIAEMLSVDDKEAVNIFLLTAGIPSLLSLYNSAIPFDENVKAMLNTNSYFYHLASNWMSECFRTPESYNTLLYAMANCYNRISELSAFLGYPKNKCDKYLKALEEHGLIHKVPGKNGHTKYYPASSYLSLWYKIFLTAVPNVDCTFNENTYASFMKYFNDVLLSSFYKEMCAYWLSENINSNSAEYINTKDSTYQNINIGEIIFDFAYQKKRSVYAYYDTTFGNGLTAKLWREIERVTTKDTPFYNNEYFLCTVNRVPESYWQLSKTYDNVHIIQLKSLFATYNKEYNRRVHPRFVPSFVRHR